MRVTGQLVGGDKVADILAEFICRRAGHRSGLKASNAIGILRGEEIIVAVAYNQFQWPNLNMHIAAKPGAAWASPGFLFHMFAYPFLQLNCRRVTGLIARKDKPTRNIAERLGFKLEGTMREALPKDDLMVYGLIKKECRWLSWGQERKVA